MFIHTARTYILVHASSDERHENMIKPQVATITHGLIIDYLQIFRRIELLDIGW